HAVASEQPEDLPLLELQGQALEDISVPVIRVNVLNFQDRHGSGGPQVDLLHLLAAADLLRRSGLQHLAEMEDGNMLGDVEYHVHIVLDEEDREVAIEVGEKLIISEDSPDERPAAGSSRSRIFGSLARPRMISSCRCSPCDR